MQIKFKFNTINFITGIFIFLVSLYQLYEYKITGCIQFSKLPEKCGDFAATYYIGVWLFLALGLFSLSASIFSLKKADEQKENTFKKKQE